MQQVAFRRMFSMAGVSALSTLVLMVCPSAAWALAPEDEASELAVAASVEAAPQERFAAEDAQEEQASVDVEGESASLDADAPAVSPGEAGPLDSAPEIEQPAAETEASSVAAAAEGPATNPVEVPSSSAEPESLGQEAALEQPAAEPAAPAPAASSSTPAPVASGSAPATAAPTKRAARVTAKAAPDAETPAATGEEEPPAAPDVADGTYVLAWSKNTKHIAASAKKSRKAGANVRLVQDADITRQRWTVKYRPKLGVFTVVNEYTKKALAVASAKKGANVLQVKAKASDTAQQWFIEKVKGGYLISPTANPKLALTVKSIKGGYDLVVAVSKGNDKQVFRLKQAGLLRGGIYSVALSKSKKQVVEIPDYSMKDGARLQLNAYSGVLSQKFKVAYLGDNRYTLQSLNSGKFVGASKGKAVQASSADAAAQQWNAVWNGTGLAFQNVATGQRICVPKAATKVKTKLTAAAAANDASQRFTLTSRYAIEAGTYVIHTFSGSRALDVHGASMDELTSVEAKKLSDSNSQKFRIEYVKGKRFKIINLKSGKAVGVASTKDGGNVRQRSYNGSKHQQWTAKVSPDGGVVFVNVASKLNMDVVGGSPSSTANVRNAKANGGVGQRWWLETTTSNKDEEVVDRAFAKAYAQGSATSYFIAVDVSKHRTFIFKRSGSSWKLAKDWVCSTGAPSTPTVLGTYTVGIKGYSFGSGYTCYYYTQFYGDYLFHSVKYYEGTKKVKDGRLGQDVSEGCVRLNIKNAKWIYDNIPSGTKVITYK